MIFESLTATLALLSLRFAAALEGRCLPDNVLDRPTRRPDAPLPLLLNCCMDAEAGLVRILLFPSVVALTLEEDDKVVVVVVLLLSFLLVFSSNPILYLLSIVDTSKANKGGCNKANTPCL